MGNKTNDQRARVATALERVRSQIGLVLGAAEGARRQAEAELEKLDLERQIVAAGMNHATAEQQAGWRLHSASAEVFPLLRSVRSQFYSDWTAGPNALRELVTANAPGPAGRPPGDWLGRVGVNTGISAPGLWRVGSATVEGQDIARVFDVAIPLLDESHLAITSAPKTRPVVDGIVENLLMRVLSTFEPGAVRVHLWDVGRLTAVLPNLYPLSRTSALTLYDPSRVNDLLDELAGHIRRIHATGMQAGYTSLREIRQTTGQRREPWRIAVLYGNGETLEPERARDLKRVASGAVAAGISLILVDVPTTLSTSVETISLLDERRAISSMTGTELVVDLDSAFPSSQVSRAASRIAEALIAKQGGPRSFADLLPTELGKEGSARELRAPVGFY
ncbi:MAG TPA: cell division protein FtsK, partial [Chloroflexota bacterium]